jgi:hypothetical protein
LFGSDQRPFGEVLFYEVLGDPAGACSLEQRDPFGVEIREVDDVPNIVVGSFRIHAKTLCRIAYDELASS